MITCFPSIKKKKQTKKTTDPNPAVPGVSREIIFLSEAFNAG